MSGRREIQEERQADGKSQEATWEQKVWRSMWVILRALKPLILYLALPAILMCAGMILGRGRNGESLAKTSGNFYYTAGILATFWILYRRSRKRGSSLWEDATLYPKERDVGKILLLLGIGFGCSLTFSAILTLVPFPAILTEGYARASDGVGAGTDPVLAFISTMLLAPVVEEVIFRGYMLNRLLSGFEEREAMFISSLVFALCHVSLAWMAYAFLMGMLLAWVSIREDNILYSVALHIGFNASVLPLWLLNGTGIFDRGWVGLPVKLAVGICGCWAAFCLYRRYRKEEPYA